MYIKLYRMQRDTHTVLYICHKAYHELNLSQAVLVVKVLHYEIGGSGRVETCECWRGRRAPLQARIGLRRAVYTARASRLLSADPHTALPHCCHPRRRLPPHLRPAPLSPCHIIAKGRLASQCRRRASRPVPKSRSARWRPSWGEGVALMCARACAPVGKRLRKGAASGGTISRRTAGGTVRRTMRRRSRRHAGCDGKIVKYARRQIQ